MKTKHLSVKKFIQDQRGDMAAKVTMLGKGVIAVVVIGILLGLARAFAPDAWNRFINFLWTTLGI